MFVPTSGRPYHRDLCNDGAGKRVPILPISLHWAPPSRQSWERLDNHKQYLMLTSKLSPIKKQRSTKNNKKKVNNASVGKYLLIANVCVKKTLKRFSQEYRLLAIKNTSYLASIAQRVEPNVDIFTETEHFQPPPTSFPPFVILKTFSCLKNFKTNC